MARRRRQRGLSNHTVKLGWTEVRGAGVFLLRALWSLLQLLGKAVVPWTLLTYCYEAVDHALFRRIGFCSSMRVTLWDKMADIFGSDSSRRERLLFWAQEQVPHLVLGDLSLAWCDGVALCALLEALYPGACPRYDLLKPQNKVNNCRLALKLSYKYAGTPMTVISAEEMALGELESEPKMLKLLSLIHVKMQTPSPNQHLLPRTKVGACTCKGSGLVAGLVGKCCKFSIYTPPNEDINLLIEIRGPNNEICSEKITNLNIVQTCDKNKMVFGPDQRDRAGWLWKASAAKVLHNGVPTICRQNSAIMTKQIKDKEKIPFDYQCPRDGQFLVSYIPRSEGAHVVTIQWQGKDIKGSPYKVAIAATMERLNQETRVRMCPHPQQQEMLPLNNMVIPLISTSGEGQDGEADQPAVAAVLKRTSTFHRSISSTCTVPAEQLARQTTITRRRILRRVITKAGQEIIIHEAPSDPSSRTSSQESGSSSRASSPSLSEHNHKKRPHRSKHPRLFDFQYSFESDSSEASRPSTPSGPKNRHVAEEVAVGMLSYIINETFRVIKRKEQASILEIRKKEVAEYNTVCKQGNFKRSTSDITLLSNISFDMNEDNDVFVNTTKKEEQEQGTKPHSKLSPRYSLPLQKHRRSEPILSRSDLLQVTNEHLKHTEKDAMLLFQRSVKQNEQNEKTNGNRSSLENANVRISTSDTPQKSPSPIPEVVEIKEVLHEPEERKCSSTQFEAIQQRNEKPLVRKTFSDPYTEKLPRPKPIRSNTVTGSPTEEVLKGAKLASLHSDSMKKVCFYNRQKAIENQSASSSNESNKSTDHEGSSTITTAVSSVNQTDTDSECCMVSSIDSDSRAPTSPKEKMLFHEFDRNHGWTQTNFRLSMSLPSLSKKWQAFELDPDDDIQTDVMLGRGYTRKKRATLGSNELTDDLRMLQQSEDFRSICDKESIKSQTPTSDTMFLKLNTPNPSPIISPLNGSPVSSPSVSGKSSRRASREHPIWGSIDESEQVPYIGPLIRSTSVGKDVVAGPTLERVNEEHGSEMDTGEAHPVKTTIPTNQASVFRVIHSPTQETNRHVCVVPKVKVDQSTQVAYDQIKAETKWVRPECQLRQRRKFIRTVAIEKSSSSSLESGIPFCVSKPLIPQIVYEGSHEVDRQQAALNALADAAQLLLPEEGEERLLHPVRQSTVDTVDSGIADDNAKLERVASIPRLLSRQRFISGHRAVTRRTYRGKISLDPKLTDTINDSPVDAEHYGVSRKRSSNTVGKDDGEPIRRRISRGRNKRRVMFSRRVMMYRRSSSRASSSRASRSSRELSQSISFIHDSGPSKAIHKPNLVNVKKNVAEAKRIATYEEKSEQEESYCTESDQWDDQLEKSREETPSISFQSFSTPADPRQQGEYHEDTAQSRKFFDRDNADFDSIFQSFSQTEEDQEDMDVFKGELIDPSLFSAYTEDSNGMDTLKESSANKGYLEQHSSESYDGYGVMSTTRGDLLSQVEMFRSIASSTPKSSIIGNASPGRLSTSTMFSDSEASCSDAAPTRRSMSVGDEWGTDHLPLGEDYISFTGLLDGKRRQLLSPDTSPSIPPLAAPSAEEEILRAEDLVPKAENCQASGAGLHYGQVGVKNNFQVHSDRAGNGSLNVTITGPRPHTVTETNVTYTGDNIYEVTYEVLQPGYYIISARWADVNIPDSPFICKVTF